MTQRMDDSARRKETDGPANQAGRSASDVLLEQMDQVIAMWRSLVRPKPWADLPARRLVDSLPVILRSLVRGARVGATSVDDDLKDVIARDHGLSRREDEIPVMAVAEEWALLKHACSRVLADRGISADDAAQTLDQLDVLMDDAIGYTLRGYYKKELDILRGRGLERRDREEDRRADVERQANDRRREHTEE